MIQLKPLDRNGIVQAQATVTKHHYLHKPVDTRRSVEGYEIRLNLKLAGYLLFGRPQATQCGNWYGDVEDVHSGKCEVTRWQVLNLARAWINPDFQYGGKSYSIDLPGFIDRFGQFRSTLASAVLEAAVTRIGFDYLIHRPPCFLDEPYEIKWLLSYCDTRLHKGTIYKAAGFELYRTNGNSIQTWRISLPPLTPNEDDRVCEAARINPRSIRYRARRAQLPLFA